MGFQIGAMVLAIGLLGGAALWGIRGLHHDLGSAVAGYAELRELFEVGSHIRTAQTLLSLENPDRHQAMKEIQDATTIMGLGPSEHHPRQKEELKTELKKVQAELWPALVDNSQAIANANASLNKTLRQISNLATEIRTRSQEKQAAKAQLKAERRTGAQPSNSQAANTPEPDPDDPYAQPKGLDFHDF